jgi:ubiquitin carboxyl-terminal hydrolase L5
MSNDWCTIESDPGVFTCLIESFGVKGAELSELWSLDEDSLMQLGKVYGLIFLFKWEQEHQTSSGSGDDGGNINRVPLTEDEIPSDLFFARQTVTNACATQAILSVLLNAADTNSSDLTLGPVLSEFKSFTSSFPPYLKGEAIGGSEEIRVSHNSFSRNDPFLGK